FPFASLSPVGLTPSLSSFPTRRSSDLDNAAIVKLAKKTFGGVDVIFLNAGLMPNSPLSALKTDDWHRMVDVNIKGVLNGVAAVRSEEHTSELQSRFDLVCRLLLEKKKQ